MTVDLRLVEVKPGRKVLLSWLQQMFPPEEPGKLVFFAKALNLDAAQLGNLVHRLWKHDLAAALTTGEHSLELQEYLIDIGYEPLIESGEVSLVQDATAPDQDLLAELFAQAEVQVAQSIEDIISKMTDVLGAVPGKDGELVFETLMQVNKQRPDMLGVHLPRVRRGHEPPTLAIFDVSGSVSEPTVRAVVESVVALGYRANAHLVIVSNTATHWEPGDYSIDTVLARAEYAGTHYEELAPLLQQDWGVVITIADYDSSWRVKDVIAQCTGTIDTVLDISLVSQPTYLAEVVGQLAREVRPLMVAATNDCCI